LKNPSGIRLTHGPLTATVQPNLA